MHLPLALSSVVPLQEVEHLVLTLSHILKLLILAVLVHNHHLAKKHGKYYFDSAADLWKEWHSDASVNGLAVDVSNTVLIGMQGGTICTCPSGNKYKVGAILADNTNVTANLQVAKNYYQTCVDGVIDTSAIVESATDESNINLSEYGLRSVHCDVSGWEQSPQYLDTQCDYTDATKKNECLTALLIAAKNNRSQGYFYLSAQKWTEFKHYKDKVHGAYSPCMYLHFRLGTSDAQDLSSASASYFYDQINTDDLKNTAFENRLGNWDELLDKCLSFSNISGEALCNFDNTWSSQNWHGLDTATHGTALDTIQTAYKAHLKSHCDNASNIGETCVTSNGTPEDTAHKQMCQDAHDAEFILDELAVLGVGCPLPKDRYIPPPPEPCWYAGEQNCPDPEVEQCDKIVRNMKKITESVKLTTKMGECFNTVMDATNIETSLRYYCVSQGIQDAALANGTTTETTTLNISYKKDLGLSEYTQNANDKTTNDDTIYLPGKPAYLQKVKATLKKIKQDDALDAELEWWNSLNAAATKAGN